MQRPLLLARRGRRRGRVGEHTSPVGEHHLRERRARAKERLSVCGDGAPVGQRARLRYQRGGARANLGGVLRAEVRASLGASDRVEQLLRCCAEASSSRSALQSRTNWHAAVAPGAPHTRMMGSAGRSRTMVSPHRMQRIACTEASSEASSAICASSI